MQALPRYDAKRAGYEACTGCNLCVLPCPVFRATSDLTLTLRGRARAVQSGAGAEEIRASLAACVTCGACEPVCPEDIDTVGWTLEWRTRLASPLAAPLPAKPVESAVDARRALLPGGLDARSVTRIADALGLAVASDSGEDLAHALEAGLPLDERRLARFVESLAACRELVVADGRLHALLRRGLPGVKVIGIAEAMLKETRLGAGDLLVLEPRGYHSDFSRLVSVWDAVRKETGAQIALDLHRLAIATGAGSLRGVGGGFPVAEQARWLLEGRTVTRVVVESMHDLEALRAVTDVPVVHVSELVS